MKGPNSVRLDAVEMFCVAARTQSFTAAAVSLGTTPSAVSKAVQRLETRLGLRLFARTTRAVRLTDEGQLYYDSCQQALDRINETETALTLEQIPRGVLRVSLPYSYGIKRVIPLISEYMARYGERVTVEVSLSNATVDFVRQDFDMAVRIGTVADSRLVARPLDQTGRIVVATPSYLSKYGHPRQPGDLVRHQCIGMLMPDTGRCLPWLFRTEGDQLSEVAIRPALALDHPLGTLAAVTSGAGIAQLLDFTVQEDLASGRLVELLGTYAPPPQMVSAVYPSHRYVPAKVRTFIDFLLERL
ncbi:LysR family transcriptional regulator [Cupriavidus necator]|uniref:LysR family transcriptional regulator n=1 Tax=Cupriavidus necator TaxID=106590 RepID=UPI003ECE9467